MPWNSPIQSAVLTVGNNFEAFVDATPAALLLPINPGETLDLRFNLAGPVGTPTDDVDIQALGGHRLIQDGVTADVTSTTVIGLAVGDQKADDYYIGNFFVMTSGGEQGELREISDYANTANDVTLLRALSAAPTAAETYSIFSMSEVGRVILPADNPITEDLPGNVGMSISGVPFVFVRARRTGTTDAHKVRMSYSDNAIDL